VLAPREEVGEICGLAVDSEALGPGVRVSVSLEVLVQPPPAGSVEVPPSRAGAAAVDQGAKAAAIRSSVQPAPLAWTPRRRAQPSRPRFDPLIAQYRP
jgi:hypothetical protein